jgi:hypothetical protein
MNSFVSEVAEVPHLTTARKTAGSVEGVHFIDTERTPAFTVKPVGAVGAEAIATFPSRHVSEKLSAHSVSDEVRVDDVIPNSLRMSPIDIV